MEMRSRLFIWCGESKADDSRMGEGPPFIKMSVPDAKRPRAQKKCCYSDASVRFSGRSAVAAAVSDDVLGISADVLGFNAGHYQCDAKSGYVKRSIS